MAKLKVYRTPIGFHDAYVAAPSQKAALDAWGSDKDLFARGVAEVVTDAKLSEAPLARPGDVIRVARTEADAAPEPPRRTAPRRPGAEPAAEPQPAPKSSPKPKPKPKPSRAELDAAEIALDDAATRHRQVLAAIERRQAELDRERRTARREADGEERRLTRERDDAKARYDAALARWRG